MKTNKKMNSEKQAEAPAATPAPTSANAGKAGLPGIIRWFISGTFRHACAMRKHVRNILNAQRDILAPQAIEAVSSSLGEFDKAIRSNIKKDELLKQMENLEEAANKWLKPYPNAGLRENVEVFLVALAVAMGIRTFFVQPFKIPTGSMQPTLYGVTSENLIDRPDVKIPTGLTRLREWFEGVSYIEVKAKADGKIERWNNAVGIRIIDFYQTFYLGGKAHTIFLPPDFGSPPGGTLQARAGWAYHDQFGDHPTEQGMKTYHAGDVIARFKVIAGDHLFVDRLTYNFRKPKRGEIIVFETGGIEEQARERWGMPGDQFYIKRLVALGGEHVQIGKDNHLVINGRRLDASTPHFENVYSGNDGYIGHLPIQSFANNQTYDLRPNHLMVMGDNTGNSLDSRFFGDFDANAVIGKSSFVYWPITKRFGWGHR